jgi:hypothetical protein
MQQSEDELACPKPSERPACHNQYLAGNDKQHIRSMYHEYNGGKQMQRVRL